MKVLQLIQTPQLRGAEIFASQLSTQLKASGVQVDLVYLFVGEKNQLVEAFSNLKFIPLHGNRNARSFDLRAFRALDKVIREGGYDIVQANAGDTLKYAALSKKIHRWNAKLVFRNANKMSAFVRGSLHLLFNRWLLKQCDQIISVSENCRQDICTILPAARDFSITIPIGTYDFSHLAPIERQVIGPVWINIGSFVPEKNHEFLIDLFAAYFRKTGSGNLWLVGGGRLEPVLRQMVADSGLQDRVVFMGYRSDAVAILKAADILVMPSRIEGLPGVILEAFSCGIPVVASAVGGIPEVVENAVTGFSIKGFGMRDYLDAIATLSDSEPTRKKIVSRAENLVRQEFMMDRIAARFWNAYQKIAKTRRDK